jgi:hypothetical protein
MLLFIEFTPEVMDEYGVAIAVISIGLLIILASCPIKR